MKPTSFPQQNAILAEDQPQYQTLPVCVEPDEIISCWKLSWPERLAILFTGTLWLRQLTCGGRLQPQLPQVESPFIP